MNTKTVSLAPIVLFAYNRPWHLAQTLQALSNNRLASDSELYIYCDGAKPGATAEQLAAVEGTREVARRASGFKSVEITERDENFGLARSIISGVTEIVEHFGRVIVLEDDLITSPFFLKFMNEALDLYILEKDVISIGANTFFSKSNKLPEIFFLPMPDSWGWATWKDRWDLFEHDGLKLSKALEKNNLIDTFNLEGAFDFYGMLENQISGKVDSWAIRWQAVAYLNKKITLYPGRSLTLNIGFGSDATHTTEAPPLQMDLNVADRGIAVFLKKIQIDKDVYKELRFYYLNYLFKNKKIIKIKFIKKIIPIFFMNFLKKIKKKLKNKFLHQNDHNQFLFRGNYGSWEEALKQSDGYDAPQILEKVLKATFKVKFGISKYERDSVVFDTIQYPWPLITTLLDVAVEKNSILHIIDFGGSLGTTYFQCRSFLRNIKKWSWNIVEQKQFVEYGKNFISDDQLDFFYNIEDVLLNNCDINILIISGSLQYIPNPYVFLDNLLSYGFSYIFFDRTPFIFGSSDRLTLQHVPKEIYDAIYPAWFFEEEKFLTIFKKKGYFLKYKFDSSFDEPTILQDGLKAEWKGMLFSLI